MSPQPAVPSLGRMLGRAMLRRCPRCGSGRLFTRWFQMAERCPRCRFRFERRAEEGSFLGAYVLNLAVTEGALAAVLFGYIIVRANSDSGGRLWPVLVLGGLVAVVLPLAFYPFSRTLWAAIDLAARPLGDDEI
ncbi:MAG TPA: DUF983 domain-containing protein [Acidimicrobiales bacterium]|nr:DUF983 domain-containing protein [Acidimicrobiales bacterium]